MCVLFTRVRELICTLHTLIYLTTYNSTEIKYSVLVCINGLNVCPAGHTQSIDREEETFQMKW